MNPDPPLPSSLENWDIEDVHIPNPIENLEIRSFKQFNRDSEMPSNEKETEEKILSNRLDTKMVRFSPTHQDFHKKIQRKDTKIEEISTLDYRKTNSKFFKAMIKFYFVKKFIRILRQNTVHWQQKWLKNVQFSLISDWAYFPGIMNKKKERFQRIQMTFLKFIGKGGIKTIKELFGSTWIIHPTSNFRLIWDLLQIFLSVFYFIFIPLSIGFSHDFLKEWPIMKYFSFILFFMDIFFNFNTAFYYKGELMTSKAMIVKHYFRGRFFYDLFSLSYLMLTEIFSASIDSFLVKITGFFFIFRIYNLSKTVSRFEEFLFTDEYVDNIISFVRLISGILLFSHWSACFWILLGEYEYLNDPNSWISYYKANNMELIAQYIYSLYFVVVVMNTVGFGDVTANTFKERVFTICFIFFACVMFAYMINRVGMILHNINKNERELRRNLNVINGFMKIKNIDFNLKIKVRNYLEYIWQVEKNQNLHETQEIINRLSSSLKEELLLNANGVFLKDIPFLNNHFSEESLRKMVYEMKEINLTPGDVIFRENGIEDQNLYIVRDGEIELYIDNTRGDRKTNSLKILKKGAYFGELSLFSNLPRSSSAKSISFSSLFVIKQDNFINILKENPDDYERFCLIKDEINLYKNFTGVGLFCWGCKNSNSNHNVVNCPMLHLIPCVERTLEKYNYNVPNQRKKFQRKSRKSVLNSLKDIKIIQNLAQKITKELFEKPYDAESLSDIDSGTANSFEHIHPLEIDQLSPMKSEEKQQIFLRKFSQKSPMLNPNSASLKGKDEKEEQTTGKYQSQPNLEVLNLLQNSYDIDGLKSFQVYFPNQNIQEFLVRINKLVDKKLKRMRTLTNFYSLMHHKSSSVSNDSVRIKRKKTQVEKEFFQKKKRKSTALIASDYFVSVFKRTRDSMMRKSKIKVKIMEGFSKVKSCLGIIKSKFRKCYNKE